MTPNLGGWKVSNFQPHAKPKFKLMKLNRFPSLLLGILTGLFSACGLSSNGPVDTDLLEEVGQALPGYQITFASPRKLGNQDIWIVNADGSGERNLTGSQDGQDIYPEWGPKGEFIYYTSNKHGGTLELYRVNTVGEPNPQQISLFDREVRSLSVSADNQRIALGIMSSNVALGEDLKPYSADLYFLRREILDEALAEGRLITLADLDLVLSEPQEQHIWHEQPDWGKQAGDANPWLAYARTENYDNDPIMKDEIWLMRADGTENQLLLSGDSMPRWSADGRLIATHQFQIVDVSTGTVRKLKIDGLARDAGSASISPDNQYVLFETDDRNRQAGIAKLAFQDDSNISNNPYTMLIDRPAYEPRWSPLPVPTE